MINNKILNSKDLDVCRGILEDLHDGKKLGYSELVEELLINFGVKTTKEELIKLDEPTAYDERLDLLLQYKNIN